MSNTWEVIVVGGGVAGLSAALMLGRARRRVLVIDAGAPRNRFADAMHGVLGNEGVNPADLLVSGRREVAQYGVEIRTGNIERVTEQDSGLAVDLHDGTRLSARALVVASGMTDELPDVPGLGERWGTTVLHCPYCHGWEVHGRRLGVLGVSPMSLHQAQLIRQWSEDVVLFAAPGLLDDTIADRLRSRDVRIVGPAVEVLGEGTGITGVRTADGQVVAVDALFSASVPRPHDDFLADLALDRVDTPVGRFLAVDAMGRTSSPRIWAAGNVVNPAATVPVSAGAGNSVGGAVNMALVNEDFDRALIEGMDR
ncbi:NAD(P)/FAD-dependent oxidoreductase [Tessaracoccus sp. SD287]|uniref:NAD(P)/FAD-dependent oxidoreductase n=1 Tax=Tessaracoccus sp. SD287 TaxID=2782008 RepID=UPI001A95F252|nr:NAD(P)/FAD-dependent oxidoreductase [Tessaracoccus sp. SD287]